MVEAADDYELSEEIIEILRDDENGADQDIKW